MHLEKSNSLIKTIEEIDKIRQAGKIVALVHNYVKELAKPGVKLNYIDSKINKFIFENNCKPAFLNFMGYPNSICASINNALVHGVPGEYELKNGDLFSIDVGVIYKGFVADGATTFIVGKSENKRTIELIKSTKEILGAAIDIAKEGTTLGDIGYLISKMAKEKGFVVSKNYAGHFIGREMHELPLVLNYGKKSSGLKLKEGMTLCIEPILIDGPENLFVDPIDNWTVRTRNGSLSAHEEHTIVVGKNKGVILTKI